MGHWNVSIKRNPEVLERIKKLYREGLSFSVIAQRVGMSQPGVRRIVTQMRKEDPSWQEKA